MVETNPDYLQHLRDENKRLKMELAQVKKDRGELFDCLRNALAERDEARNVGRRFFVKGGPLMAESRRLVISENPWLEEESK